MLFDLVFSIDNLHTAVGMTEHVPILVIVAHGPGRYVYAMAFSTFVEAPNMLIAALG